MERKGGEDSLIGEGKYRIWKSLMICTLGQKEKKRDNNFKRWPTKHISLALRKKERSRMMVVQNQSLRYTKKSSRRVNFIDI